MPASRHLKESRVERGRHQERVATLKRRLAEAGLPMMPSPSHIVPVLVGDPGLTSEVAASAMAWLAALDMAEAVGTARAVFA